MEFEILTKVGYVVNAIVGCGYTVAGSYLVRTAVTYFKDYKESADKEVF